nr:tRNA pseudouridine(13) synthase TruD [Methylomicrobium agile]
MAGDRDKAEAQLDALQVSGIPNYFGEQRFGHRGAMSNRRWPCSREEGRPRAAQLYLSAARSFLFNQVLAGRVEQRTWNRPLPAKSACWTSRTAVSKPIPWIRR